jgi:hypothetical protein
MSAPTLPRYDRAALSDLVPSVAAHLGLPGEDVLGLPDADRYVLLLIDGLGSAQLAEAAADAPYLAGLLGGAFALTSVVPSTTATALTSLGTGLPPGQHGLAGFTFRNPFTGGLLNSLAWEPGLSGLDIQPRLTAYERLAKAGVLISTAMPAHFAGTGLTEAGLRGGRFLGVTDESALERRVEQIVDAATSGPRTFVYAYERSLDHEGHGHGWRSPQWRAALTWADELATRLRAALPDDVRLLVTADHGMVDVPASARLIVEDEPDLAAELDLLAGEGRLRHLYTARPAAVAARWRAGLGARAWVRTRAEAVEEGWFGRLAPQLADRFGDVLVALRGDHAVMSRTFPRELGLIGMHGSLTAAEMHLPLLVD